MTEIEKSVDVVRKALAEARKSKRERDDINETAKKQRVEIKRLKRLLERAVSLIPPTVRDDKLFEEIDTAIHREEL